MTILEESVGDLKKNSVFVTLDDSHSSVASKSSEIVLRPSHSNAEESKTDDSAPTAIFCSSPVSHNKSVII